MYIFIVTISTKDRKTRSEYLLPRTIGQTNDSREEIKRREKISMKQRSNNSLYRRKIHRERRLRGRKMQRRKFSPGACIPFVNRVVRTLTLV